MKKKLLALFVAAVAAVTVCSLALAGCSGDVKKINFEDYEHTYVFTASNDVLTITDDTTVKDYLDALVAKGDMTYDGYEGSYGYYITTINGTQEVMSEDYSSGSSWMIYIDFTTLDGDDGIYASTDTVCLYKGTKLYLASYGVSGIPCVAGHTYAFVFEDWVYVG